MKMENGRSDIVINPVRQQGELEIPSRGLLLVNTVEARYGCEAILRHGGTKHRFFNSQLVTTKEETAFVAGPALGAPMAAMVLEKLVVLGAKSIILCGWCGAVTNSLRIGDIVIPDDSLPGEGTSPYYRCEKQYEPDQELRKKLVTMLQARGIEVNAGKIWSTDAIYRESRQYLKNLHNRRGVTVVDMEFSALASVARFRGVSFAGVLVVSDLVFGASWRPGFHEKPFKRGRKQLLDALLEDVQNL